MMTKLPCFVVALLLSTAALGSSAEPSPAPSALTPPATNAAVEDFGKHLCDKLDSYLPGSFHYFDCLDANKDFAPQADSPLALVRKLCSAAQDFYGFQVTHALRCYEDALDLLLATTTPPSH